MTGISFLSSQMWSVVALRTGVDSNNSFLKQEKMGSHKPSTEEVPEDITTDRGLTAPAVKRRWPVVKRLI